MRFDNSTFCGGLLLVTGSMTFFVISVHLRSSFCQISRIEAQFLAFSSHYNFHLIIIANLVEERLGSGLCLTGRSIFADHDSGPQGEYKKSSEKKENYSGQKAL